jgi:predicted deacylase
MTKSVLPLPSPAAGTQRSLTIHRYGRLGARPKAYFQAAIHADEVPGLLVIHHLLNLLEKANAANHIKGEVIVVPVANPIGLAQHLNGNLLGRFDFAASGNFNRNFSRFSNHVLLAQLADRMTQDQESNISLIRQTLLQGVAKQRPLKEADVLKNTLLSLSIDADLVFDLHCDLEALLHLYAPGYHREKALALGAEMGAQAIFLENDPSEGAFDAANAAPWWRLAQHVGNRKPIPLACFAATVELRGQTEVDDQLASQDAHHLYRFLQRHSVISGDPGSLPKARCTAIPLEAVDIVKAPQAGLVAYRKALGDWVEQDEPIADLIDPLEVASQTTRIPLCSRTAGILVTRSAIKLVTAGQSIGKVAGQDPLPHRKPGNLLED